VLVRGQQDSDDARMAHADELQQIDPGRPGMFWSLMMM